MKKCKRTTVEIRRHKDNPVCAVVFINGQKIHGARSIEYTHEAGELPVLTLDLGGMKLENILINFKTDELVILQIK